MFAFLIAPQRFLFSPLARRDRRLLRQQHLAAPIALRVLAYLSSIPFLILAFLPTQIYFTRQHVPLLMLMSASSVFLSIVVGMRTLAIASHLMAREQGLSQWEQLIMTKMDARQIVLSKWISVLPAVWFWHMLVALTRLGVALGFAQVFHHDISIWNCPFGATIFCHTSHNYGYGGFPVVMQPDWWKIVLAAGTLIGFALLEAMLLSGLGVLGAMLAKSESLKRLIAGIGMRVVLVLFGASLLAASEFNFHFAEALRGNPQNDSCQASVRDARAFRGRGCWDWKSVLETLETDGMSLADDGTGLASLIMRPTGSRIFVLRQLVGAMIGMSLFVLTIWLVLRVAVWLAVRQRALRPGYI